MKKKISKFKKDASKASTLLKAISNENRLMVLCKLMECPMSVNELLQNLDISQSALSQNLIKMKDEGILASKQRGTQNIYYIKNDIVDDIFKVLYKHFCGAKNEH